MFRVVENPWYSTSLSKVCHYIDIHVLTWSVLRYSVYADRGKSMNLKLPGLEDPGKGLEKALIPENTKRPGKWAARILLCKKTVHGLNQQVKSYGISFSFITMHAGCGAVYCNHPCLSVCLFVGLLPR